MSLRSWTAWLVGIALVLAPMAACNSSDTGGWSPQNTGGAGAAGAGGFAGQGGLGGSSGTGADAGGSAGTPATDAGDASPVECPVQQLKFNAACETCANTSCCPQLQTCDFDPACVALVKCVAGCPVDDAGLHHDPDCVQTCAGKLGDAAVPSGYNPLATCLGNEACGPVCPF